MFIAKKITPKSYALFEDGREFARLQIVRGKYLLSAANADLKRLFDATRLTADATLQAVLWAIHAMLDHLAEIAGRLADANEREADFVKFAAEFNPTINPHNGRLTFAPIRVLA